MLDLKALEKEIDELIAKDTPEDMLAWLNKEKMEEFAGFLEDGTVERLGGDSESSFINPVTACKPHNKDPFVSASKNYDYGRAA
jgi:hypothetical protein